MKDVQMKGFKLFNVISEKTGADALKDSKLSTIDIKSEIKNNLIKKGHLDVKKISN